MAIELSLPDEEAETVARKLLDEFVYRFSTWERIHTDQYSIFESAMFMEVCCYCYM